MRSPKDMRIIEIDITNACIHSCSNCTRFCGHHKKPFFMDFETFKKAVDSLSGFGKCIGVMGGEPTIHPQFERFIRYIGEKYPSKYHIPGGKEPVQNFSEYIHDKNFILDECLNNRKGPGLLSSITKQYYENFELIQDTFGFQNMNDHNNPCLHQPMLASRKDFGIPDEEWYPMRDRCFFQNTWSATVTPKGAFFCEIAGALDMLFDGPGGWKIEPGWWKREPEDFGDQLKWCEICGGALFHKGRLSSDEIDDVSPTLYRKLQEAGSPKLKAGKVVILNDISYPNGKAMSDDTNRYLANHTQRVSGHNSRLYPQQIDEVTVSNSIAFGRDFIVKAKNCPDWIFLTDKPQTISEELTERLKKVVLNPGVLYKTDSIGICGFLFHPSAQALKCAGYDGIVNCKDTAEFCAFWSKENQIDLLPNFDAFQNPDVTAWKDFAGRLSLGEKQKSAVDKCLRKIESDYK